MNAKRSHYVDVYLLERGQISTGARFFLVNYSVFLNCSAQFNMFSGGGGHKQRTIHSSHRIKRERNVWCF